MKKIILILLFSVACAAAQLLPVTPAERAVIDIDRAAAASRYYAEQYAQSLSLLHHCIFSIDDVTLKAVLEKLGQQKSEELIGLYIASATGINQILSAGGSSVRAPLERTREWVWSDEGVTITPLPSDQ